MGRARHHIEPQLQRLGTLTYCQARQRVTVALFELCSDDNFASLHIITQVRQCQQGFQGCQRCTQVGDYRVESACTQLKRRKLQLQTLARWHRVLLNANVRAMRNQAMVGG